MRRAPDQGARRIATWVRSNVPSGAISFDQRARSGVEAARTRADRLGDAAGG